MGITVKWDDQEQTVLRLEFKEDWTTEDMRKAGMDAILMVRLVDHPVYVVSDFTESDAVPAGVLWQARGLSEIRPANWEVGVLVTTDRLIRSLYDLFSQVYMRRHRSRLYVVGSRAEADSLLDSLKSEKRTS